MKKKKRLFSIVVALMMVFTIGIGNLSFVMAQTEGEPAAMEDASVQQEPGAENDNGIEEKRDSLADTETKEETSSEEITEETIEGSTEESTEEAAGEVAEPAKGDDQTIDQETEEKEEEPVKVRNGDEKVDISGVIKWSNRDKQSSSQRPTSVFITLYANGEQVDTMPVSFPGGGANANADWSFSFTNLEKNDSNGDIIRYTVRQSDLENYETSYSANTLTVTNTYIGGKPSNHTFDHIDVRIAGPQLEVNYQILDNDNSVVQEWTENITARVTRVRSVTINGTTYTGFTQSGTYEFRKTTGVRIRSQDLTSSSKAVLLVDLRDGDNVYENVEITYGLGGIMDAAYNCDGYSSNWLWESFSGLDFNVGEVQNYNIVMRSYALLVSIQKYLNNQSATAGDPWAFSGEGGEFGFTLEEQGTDRTWTVNNDSQGKAQISITYPFTSQTELEQYADGEYTYTLKETACGDEYIRDETEYTFTVGFTLNDLQNENGKSLTPYIKSGTPPNGIFVFTNLVQQKTGSLRVSKTVAGNSGDSNKDFSFSVTLDDAQINGTYGGMTFTNGIAEFTLKDGESVTASDLPAGAGYTATESDYTRDGYITSKTGDTGTITENETATAAFINTRTTYTIYIHKTDDQGNSLAGAVFDVVSSSTGQSLGTITTGANGDGSLSGLPLDDYELAETQAPTGFEPILGPVSVNASDFDPDTASAFKTIVNELIKIDIDVNKQWVGETADSVTVNLTADGAAVESAKLTARNNWQYTFRGLPKYDAADGHEIVYDVSEEFIEGYISGRSGTVETGFTFTNTITGKVSVPVTKAWIGQAADRVTINLLANGNKVDAIVLNEANGWQYTFAGLDKYDKEGKEIQYTVTEEPLAGYTTAVRGSASGGFTVINTQEPPKTDEDKGSGPKTGDEQMLYAYLLIMIAASAALLTALLISRKRSDR